MIFFQLMSVFLEIDFLKTFKNFPMPSYSYLFIDQVIHNSNILEDLYTDDELNVDNIKDRTDKIKFLQKLIDLLSESRHAILST